MYLFIDREELMTNQPQHSLSSSMDHATLVSVWNSWSQKYFSGKLNFWQTKKMALCNDSMRDSLCEDEMSAVINWKLFFFCSEIVFLINNCFDLLAEGMQDNTKFNLDIFTLTKSYVSLELFCHRWQIFFIIICWETL